MEIHWANGNIQVIRPVRENSINGEAQGGILSLIHIYNMLIDLMAAMSHKDWLSRRQRQKQGIERAHTLGKYRGKQADQERHQKVLYYRQVKKLSIRETADATGYSTSQVCRIQALYREPMTD